MNEPIPLITFDGKIQDKNASFVVNEKACQLLHELPHPIGVISIAGLYRTGKSFLLNLLAGKTNGFPLGSAVEPKTQGIWMWIVHGSTFVDYNPNMSLVILDTEGLGSYNKTENYNAQIFSLSILLSSLLIYNSMGCIDDTALDSISLLLELTKNIKYSLQESKEETLDISTFYPTFVWVVRDFSLELILDNKEISEDEYLEKVLDPIPGNSSDVESKNNLKQCIRSVFSQRYCKTLVRPVENEDLLCDLDKLKIEELRPEFLQQAKDCVEFILKKTIPKSINGCSMNGSMFVRLVRSYVDVVNRSEQFHLQSTWQNVVAMQTQDVIESSFEQLKKTMTLDAEDGILDSYELFSSHTKAFKDLLHRISQLPSNYPEKDKILQEVHKRSWKHLEQLEISNHEKSKQYNQSLVTKLIQDSFLNSKIGTYEGLQESWLKYRSGYNLQSKGPSSLDIFLSSEIPLLRIAESISQSNIEEKLNDLRNALVLKEKKMVHEYEVLKELYESVQTERLKEESTNKVLRAENKELKLKMGQLQAEKKKSDEALKEMEEKMKSIMEEKISVEAELQQRKSTYNDEKAALEDLRKSSMQEIERLKNDLRVLGEANEKMAGKKGCCGLM